MSLLYIAQTSQDRKRKAVSSRCLEGKEVGRAVLFACMPGGNHDPGAFKSERFLKGMKRPKDEPLLV